MSKSYEHSGETTEWEDILIKKGILTREEVYYKKGLNPLDYMDAKDLKLVGVNEEDEEEEDKYANLDKDELDELLDEDDNSDEKTILRYREQRLAEMREAMVRNRFGSLTNISKDEWVKEVTEASKSVSVVIHLYDDAMIECRLVDEALRVLAPKFKYVKFLRIKYSHAMENWPEKNLPTIFIYQSGALSRQLITLREIGGVKMNTNDLEWWLVKANVITDSELECDPRLDEDEPRNTVKSVTRITSNRFQDDESY